MEFPEKDKTKCFEALLAVLAFHAAVGIRHGALRGVTGVKLRSASKNDHRLAVKDQKMPCIQSQRKVTLVPCLLWLGQPKSVGHVKGSFGFPLNANPKTRHQVMPQELHSAAPRLWTRLAVGRVGLRLEVAGGALGAAVGLPFRVLYLDRHQLKPRNRFQRPPSSGFLYLLWMVAKSISRHFETMVNHCDCALVFTRESSF